MQLVPTYHYILCTLHEGHDTRGLLLPDSAEIQPYAIVRAVGPECKTLNIGDKILFNPTVAVYADTIDGEKTVILSESSVFARYDA